MAESPDVAESPEVAETPGAAPEDTHGALVSTAAQMATPEGFANRGAFVSCVAHLDVSVVGFDWATVTPAFCDAASPKAAEKAAAKAARAAEKAAAKAARAARGRRQVRRRQGEGRRRQRCTAADLGSSSRCPDGGRPTPVTTKPAPLAPASQLSGGGGGGVGLPVRVPPERITAIAFSSRSLAIVRYLARLVRSTGPMAPSTSGLRMTSRRSSTASLSCCLAATRLSSRIGSAAPRCSDQSAAASPNGDPGAVVSAPSGSSTMATRARRPSMRSRRLTTKSLVTGDGRGHFLRLRGSVTFISS